MKRAVLAVVLLLPPLLAQSCSDTTASTPPDASDAPGADAGQVASDAEMDAAVAGADDASAYPDAASSTPPDAAAEAPDAAGAAPDASATCSTVSAATALALDPVPVDDEYLLTLTANSTTATSWGTTGREAVILEVLSDGAVVGQLVLHQGTTPFAYSMHLGAVSPAVHLSVRVSALTATSAPRFAKVCGAAVVPVASLGAAMAEGTRRAPILKWPNEKRFDDLPVLLGYSKARQKFEMVYTSENGGTVESCGGGAAGMQAEYARWGRGCDIEGIYNAGTGAWDACDAPSPGTPRFEGEHPVLYFGDNHNRLFTSRGGYGQACGTGGPEMADGPVDGFNANNPGNEASKDGPFVITVRHVPVDLDALGYAQSGGRREGMLDRYAPWIYRLTSLELGREGKIDSAKCLTMERYLYVDVQVDDVGGSGDSYCSLLGVSDGFKLRANTSAGGQLSSGQMTADYVGASVAWKRLAIPLDRPYAASELTGFVFDAYDGDGIYLLAFGDAFMPRALGDNGASLEVVHAGARVENVYVDDDSSGCVGGHSPGGPADAGYPCVGGAYAFTP